MKVDIWYGESKELDTNGHAYILLTMVIPSLEQDMRKAFSYLQNIEKIYDGMLTSDFKIFDAHSSYDGEEATISVIIPINSSKVAKVIQVLNLMEKRLNDEAFEESKRRASRKQ